MLPSEPPVWAHFDRATGAWLLELHIQPGAKSTGVVGEHGDRLKLKISAPPVDNKANAFLLDWVASQLGMPKSAVSLVRGAASRQKTVSVSGANTLKLLSQIRQLTASLTFKRMI